jgi:hypothetical protein
MTQVKTTGELRPPQLTQKKGGTTRMNLIRKLYSKADGFARTDNGRVCADSRGGGGHRLCRLPDDGDDSHNHDCHRRPFVLVTRRQAFSPSKSL